MDWFHAMGFVPRERVAETAPMGQTIAPTSGDVTAQATIRAQQLTVRVVRGGKTTVDLAFPATVMARLRDLLDDELAQRIAARGIDIAQLMRRAETGELTPGTVFSDDDGRRQIEVALR